MYGLILVEPKDGLPKVDREYYVMQSEFYTDGNYGDKGLQSFNMAKALDEKPSYVVFNGAVGALTDDNAMRAKEGETIRLFVGNGGPNLVSSFHIIGEIFDHVYGEGGVVISQKNVQTTLIPSGGSAIVDFKVNVPGTYVLVDHSIFRAFNKGAVGMLKVEGKDNKDVYSGKQSDEIYLGENSKLDEGLRQSTFNIDNEGTGADNLDEETSLARIMEKGKQVFSQTCINCHQSEGQGIPNVFPPLAKSDFLMKDKMKSISIVTKGLNGPITVNGKKYNSVMPPVNINNEQTAAVLTYVRNSWGNKGDNVSVEDVQKIKKSK
jgi:nitrite reductase (NO-forming)